MNHVTKVKLLYALYTPLQNLKLTIAGVKKEGIVFIGGKLFVNRGKNSSISIGRKCRFMSKSWGNNMGLNHQCMLSTCDESDGIFIGKHCAFSGVTIRCFKKISIGDNVRVGANCLIMDGDGHQDDPRSGKNKPIFIEDNVWLGANVVVKKGVTIGKNSVIGMSSVVTKDIPANCIAIGNPCVVVKQFDETKINQIENYFHRR